MTSSLLVASKSQNCANFPILFLTVNWAIVNVNLVCFYFCLQLSNLKILPFDVADRMSTSGTHMQGGRGVLNRKLFNTSKK